MATSVDADVCGATYVDAVAVGDEATGASSEAEDRIIEPTVVDGGNSELVDSTVVSAADWLRGELSEVVTGGTTVDANGVVSDTVERSVAETSEEVVGTAVSETSVALVGNRVSEVVGSCE